MNVVFKTRNSVLKTRNCAVKPRDFVLEMMNFARPRCRCMGSKRTSNPHHNVIYGDYSERCCLWCR